MKINRIVELTVFHVKKAIPDFPLSPKAFFKFLLIYLIIIRKYSFYSNYSKKKLINIRYKTYIYFNFDINWFWIYFGDYRPTDVAFMSAFHDVHNSHISLKELLYYTLCDEIYNCILISLQKKCIKIFIWTVNVAIYVSLILALNT